MSGGKPAIPTPTAFLTSVADQSELLNDSAVQLGLARHDLGETATVMLRRSLALRPELSPAWSNLASMGLRAGRLDEALTAAQNAVRFDGSSVMHLNLATVLGALGRRDEALAEYDAAERIDPEGKFGSARRHLRYDDWRAAHALEHTRLREMQRPPVPLWQGEDLTGKTLYVQGEQGVGDRFLFSRYVAWIHETWPTCRITLNIGMDSLGDLFSEFSGIAELVQSCPPGADYAVWLASLPMLHASAPDNVPPDPGLLRRRIDRAAPSIILPPTPDGAIRVGLAWSGSPKHPANNLRAVDLSLLLPLAEDPRVHLFSFQCTPNSGDIQRLGAGELICDLGPSLEAEGWIATGRAMLEMDLMITVCTSVAHLAGALGVPTWLLTSAEPYWPWWSGGDTTAWYPSMRLFRQTRLGHWDPVIERVRAALAL